MIAKRPLTRQALRAIIKQHGGVEQFAIAVPVRPRTVWYWLAGRKMHPVFEGRVRDMAQAIEKGQ